MIAALVGAASAGVRVAVTLEATAPGVEMLEGVTSSPDADAGGGASLRLLTRLSMFGFGSWRASEAGGIITRGDDVEVGGG